MTYFIECCMIAAFGLHVMHMYLRSAACDLHVT